LGERVGVASKPLSEPLDPALSVLRTRELEIVLCFLAGDRVAEIARFVQVSRSTVRRDLKSACDALGCATIEDLRIRFRELAAA